MGIFDVEWKSHEFHPDGRKRSRPPASSVHGWIMKWRGTFSGDEQLRSRGMREMREATARRKFDRNNSGNKIPVKGSSASAPATPRSRSTDGADVQRSRSTKATPSSTPRRSNTTRTTSTPAPPRRSSSTKAPATSAKPTVARRSTTAGAPPSSGSRPAAPTRRNTTGSASKAPAAPASKPATVQRRNTTATRRPS